MNTDRYRIGALIGLAGLGLAAAAGVGSSGAARAQEPTTTIILGGPASPPPKNVWITLGGSPSSPARADARKIVACMRRNGVPNFPSPKIAGEQVSLLLPPGLNRNSPRLKRAQHACRKLLPEPGAGPSAPGPALTTTGS